VSFAAAEAAVNSAVISALWNARGDFGGADFRSSSTTARVSLRSGSFRTSPRLLSKMPSSQELLRTRRSSASMPVSRIWCAAFGSDGTGLSTLILELA
jgi:hypothetical protein